MLPLALYIASQFVSFSSIVGIAVLLCAAAVAAFNFELGLTILVLFLPFEPFLLKFVPAGFVVFFRLIPESIIAALFVRSLVQARVKGVVISDSDPIRISLFLMLGFSVISIIVNRVEPVVAAVGLRQIFRFILLYEACVLYGLKTKSVLKILGIVAVLAAFESGLGVLQAIVGNRLDNFLQTGGEFYVGELRVSQNIEQVREQGRRVFATMARYDQLGTFLALIASAAIGFVYQGSHKIKRYALVLLLLVLPGIFLSYSRSSWFGFLLALIVTAIIIKRDKKVLAALLILIAVLAGYTSYREVEVRRLIDEPQFSPFERLLEAFSQKRWREEYRNKGRFYFLPETPKALFPDHILLGVGPGQFGGGAAAALHNTKGYDELNLPYGLWGSAGVVDSNWASILGEVGILGAAAFASIFVLLILFSRRILIDERAGWLDKSLALGLIGATVCFVFMAFLGTNFENRTLAPYYWLLAALTVVSYRTDKTYANTANQ